MNPHPVNLATEDELSETVLLKIIAELNRYAVGTAYRRGGFGYLRHRVSGWNKAAPTIPFIVLTDLDEKPCPTELIRDWLKEPKHPNLLFRIAVREVESWLLADRVNFSRFLGIGQSFVPTAPDMLPDPKATLVELAARSNRRSIRESIVPKRGSTAKQGPDYNGSLGGFVRGRWDLRSAEVVSPSLARTVQRLTVFQPAWT